MEASNLDKMMAWLDPKKRPVYVLLPEQEYKRYQAAWGLPAR
jgi:hypothetical protein